jgi:PAS domain S-box-containing protein
MSEGESASLGAPSSESLAEFHAALAERRAVLVEGMAEACLRHMPITDAAHVEVFKQELGRDVDAHLRRLIDVASTALEERARGWCADAIKHEISPELVFSLGESSRAVMLDVSLGLHAQRVPGASAGIRRLMEGFSHITLLFDDLFRKRLEQVEVDARLFEIIARRAPDGFGIADLQGKMIYANPALEEIVGTEIVGKDIVALLAPAAAPLSRDDVRATVLGDAWTGTLSYPRIDGGTLEVHVSSFVTRDPLGRPAARCVTMRDLTALRRMEEETRTLQEEMITAQAAALRALSTPIVPIAEGVVVMPIVGAVDEARAERMLSVLLQGITQESAEVALLDVTGVTEGDEHAAEALLRAAHAVRLIGAEAVLTGVQPAFARALVEMNADLEGVRSMATLGDGVGYALRRSRSGERQRPPGDRG